MQGLPYMAQASGPFRIVPLYFDEPYDPQAYIAGVRFAADGRSLGQVLTYLHMAGAFGSGQQQLFNAYLQGLANNTYPAGFSQWLESLRMLGRDGTYYSTSKMLSSTVTSNGRSYTTQAGFENCLPDAFATATATLQQRTARYGQDSVQLNRWLDAQMQVFRHCGNNAFNPPAEPDPSWDALEQQDRAYQIAAAYFYDMQYAEAARRFELIGADTASPWADLGRYLVGRSLVRQALVAKVDVQQNLASAQSVFATLGQDEAYVERFPSVRGQQSFISIKQDTPAFLARVGTLLVNDPARLAPNELSDFLFLWNSGTHAVASDGSLLHWMMLANDQSAAATQRIVEAWQRYRTRPWLYLALSRKHIDSSAPVIDELAQQTAGLDASEPVTAALLVETARMLQETGRRQQALTLSEGLLAASQTSFTTTQRNRLQYIRAQSSTDWREFPVRAQLDVTALSWDTNQIFALSPEALAVATHRSRLLPPAVADLINSYYTPAMMLEVINTGRLSGYLVGRMAVAAWVKALMLDDAASAQALARSLYDYYPERREALERYLQGPASAFEAAALVLELPGYSPFLNTGIGRERMAQSGDIGFVPDHIADGINQHNWWCTMLYDYQDANAQSAYRERWLGEASVALEQAVFSSFSAEQKAELATMQPDLQQSVAAAFGPDIVEYARANPADPRVPRLLYRVVFASRYACNGGPGDVSRAAFELLHANYPDSEWTERTPYWYD
jgi:hypothetical protein